MSLRLGHAQIGEQYPSCQHSPAFCLLFPLVKPKTWMGMGLGRTFKQVVQMPSHENASCRLLAALGWRVEQGAVLEVISISHFPVLFFFFEIILLRSYWFKTLCNFRYTLLHIRFRIDCIVFTINSLVLSATTHMCPFSPFALHPSQLLSLW